MRILFILLLFYYPVFSQTDSLAQTHQADSAKIFTDTIVVMANHGPPPFDSSIFYTDTIIRWMSIGEAEAARQKEPKKIFVNIFATWCRWCRQTDSLVFKNREIAHYLNQHYYPVKFNAETRTAVTFKDRQYNFIADENKFVHELTEYWLNDKLSYPGFVFLDESGNMINTQNGYMDAIYLETLLNFYAGNWFRETTFQDFEKEFDNRIRE